MAIGLTLARMRNRIWSSSSPAYSAVRPRPVDGVVIEAWNKMPVAMIDRLPGGPAVVHDDVKSMGAGGRDDGPSKSWQEHANTGRRDSREHLPASHSVLWDQQSVTVASPGLMSRNATGLISLDQPGRGNFTADDFAKDAMRLMWCHDSGSTPTVVDRTVRQTGVMNARAIHQGRVREGTSCPAYRVSSRRQPAWSVP